MNKVRRAARPYTDLRRCYVDKAPEFAKGIYSLTNSSLGECLVSHLANSRYSEIVSASIDPMAYLNADTFGRDYLCAELMSKYPEWDLGIDRRSVALAKFRDSEAHCADTNKMMVTSLGRPLVGLPAHPVFQLASRKIEKLLYPFSWPAVFELSAWGPGATTRLKRRDRDVYHKFNGLPQATPNAFHLARALVASIPGWNPRYIEIVPGNRITTVPKNAKTDRVIAIEPDLNMVIQKGIGALIRKALNRVGLLDTRGGKNPQVLNNLLAQEGSAYGRYSTIDLSSASDTISLELARTLFPPRYRDALEQCRSEVGTLPSGEVINYQKLSSMGNGYTFEVETLIFWGIISAVLEIHGAKERQFLVFGDDIIVPSDMVGYVVDALTLAGFTVNSKKTWTSGPFRESCGKHYFHGADVTPFYIREPINDVSRLFWFANSLRRWSRLSWGLDPTYRTVYDRAVSLIPKSVRFRIPEGVGDGGLVCDFDEAHPSLSFGARKAPYGFEGFQFRHASASFNRRVFSDQPYLLKALYIYDFMGQRVEGVSRLPVPDQHKLVRVSMGLSPQWPTFGPWLGT